MTQATSWSVPLVGPASPTVFAQRIDDSLDAILSGHAGSSRPSYAVAGSVWQDTSVAGESRIYFYDGTSDILVAVVDTANDRVDLSPQPLIDVASASTTDIGAVKSRNIRVTGTTTITSFGTARTGTTRTLYFAGALSVTYNATSLITPSGASLTVSAGDTVEVVSLGSGNWRVLRHTLGVPVFASSYQSAEQTITTAGALTLAHGLGVAPKFIAPVLICKTAENSYLVGDIIPVNPSVATAANNDFGAMFEISGTTNVIVRYGSAAQSFLATHRGTGALVGCTNTNWRLIMRAFA